MRSEITMPFPSLPHRRSEPVVSELIKFLQSVGAAGNFYSNALCCFLGRQNSVVTQMPSL